MSDDIPTTTPSVSERARIDPSVTKRRDALPILYLVGFVILASALIYLWQHPTMPRGAVQEAARVTTLQQQVEARHKESEALTARVAALEGRPAPVVPNVSPLEARIAALEQRPAPAPVATPDLGPIEARIAAVEGKPAPAPVDLKPIEDRIVALEGKPAPAPVDLTPLEARIAGLEKKEAADVAAGAGALAPVAAMVAGVGVRAEKVEGQIGALTPRLDQIEARVGASEAQAKQTAAGLGAITERAGRAGRMQAAAVALAAGQRLGDIPGAPPALARFAHDAPPTEAGLRLSFDGATRAAERASQPAISDDKPFLSRLWVRAQQSVNVRQGDRVLLGDPIAGVIGHARQLLDAGDLAGAVHALDGLAGPARAAMREWIGQAQALLDARAAVASMAAAG